MKLRDNARFAKLLSKSKRRFVFAGSMKGTGRILGDIVGPVWDGGPWDAELGIAYQGEDGPVYYTGNGCETTDDLK